MRYKTNDSQRGQADHIAQGLALFLGAFSIVLGMTELIFGGAIARALGLVDYEWIVRLYGGRELLAGLLIFAFRDPIAWIWFRVAGDLLDLATVAFGYSLHLAPDFHFVIAFAALGAATLLDLYCAIRLSQNSKEPLAPRNDYVGGGPETSRAV